MPQRNPCSAGGSSSASSAAPEPEPGSETSLDRDGDASDRSRNNKTSTSSGQSTRAETPQYIFVSGQDPKSSRSYAMKVHWQRRRRSIETRRKVASRTPRQLLPNITAESPLRTSHADISTRGAWHTGTPASLIHVPFVSPPGGTRRAPQRADRRPGRPDSASSPPSSTNHNSSMAVVQRGFPSQALSGMNHALAGSRLDPFDMFPVHLTSQHHKLLHHCVLDPKPPCHDMPSDSSNSQGGARTQPWCSRGFPPPP